MNSSTNISKQVYDLLLINPPASYKNLTSVLTAQGVSYQIMVTNGVLLSYIEEPFVDLNTEPLDRVTTQWGHVFAWDKKGFLLAKFLSSKGLIKFPYPDTLTLENYADYARVEEYSAIVNTISYNKTHVLSYVLLYTENKWVFFRNQEHPLFHSIVNTAFDYINSVGVETGILQTVITGQHVRFKFGPPTDADLLAKVDKNYMDIFPLLLKQSSEESIQMFDSWSEKHRPLKNFKLN